MRVIRIKMVCTPPLLPTGVFIETSVLLVQCGGIRLKCGFQLQQIACCSWINLWHRQSGWKMNFFASFQDWSKITEGKICSISGRKEWKGVFERKSITDTDAPINRKASRCSFDIFVSFTVKIFSVVNISSAADLPMVTFECLT